MLNIVDTSWNSFKDARLEDKIAGGVDLVLNILTIVVPVAGELRAAEGLGEGARLAREAGETARLAREAGETARLAREAEEAARFAREAEEAARLAKEAEEAAKLAKEAEEAAKLSEAKPPEKGKDVNFKGEQSKPEIPEVVEHSEHMPVEGPGKTAVNYGDQYGKTGNKKILKPDVEYVDGNGYKYATDSQGRISHVDGDLVLQKGTRNEYAQRTVGGTDRLPTDNGGHMIGTQFNGSGEIDNLVPQAGSINKSGGEWYKMEQDWANALKDGSTVKVDITPNYSGSSVRPDSFDVNYWIDGELFIKNMKNP